MQNTTHTKLQAIRDKRKRWQTRLTRASNMLGKLTRQEARLLSKPETSAWQTPERPKALTPPVEIKAPVIRADDPDLVEKVAAVLDKSNGDGLDMPTFLVRPRVQQGTDEERKAMPLTGKAALEKAGIRKKSIEIEKKREKRDRAFFKP